MDDIDRAQERADMFTADAINRQLRSPRSLVSNSSSLFCEECEEPIPQRRRELIPGCRLCVACQTANEKVRR